MNNSCFGEMTFNTGWKTTTDIILFGKSIRIIVKAKAKVKTKAKSTPKKRK